MKDEPKLLPCPFCGNPASEWATEDTEWIQCGACFASTDVFDVDTGRAAAAWNQRNPPRLTTVEE